VLSDEIRLIGTTQNHAENVFHLIEVLDSKEKELYLITNRFDLSADKVLQTLQVMLGHRAVFQMDETASEH